MSKRSLHSQALVIASVLFTLASNAQDTAKTIAPKTNTAGISYDLTFFEKSSVQPWHLISLEYTSKKKLTYSIRLNMANRFNASGIQLEADAYPVISKKTYAYINAGIAGNALFPKYRTGVSLFTALPAAFEAEGGFRLLGFNAPVWIYTVSLAKYYKNYWFNLSTFLTPRDGKLAQAYFIKSRYYFHEKSYAMLTLGSGISPDDRNNNNHFSSLNNTRSKRADLNLKILFRKDNMLLMGVGMMVQKDLEKSYSNQFNTTLGYQKIF